MSLAMRAWLAVPRWRRWHPRFDLVERRSAMIAELAPGRSFVDVGGMWRIHGEMAFQAAAARARAVTLVDAMEASPEFEREREHRGDVRFQRGDLHDRDFVESRGRFDVVWCTGVLYHSPNPYELLENLRLLTGERLLLGTQLIPEVPGLDQACLFYPGLSARGRAALAWPHAGEARKMIGVGTAFDPAPGRAYANWWWGITASALRGMVTTAGFEIEREALPHPFAGDFLLRPRRL